MADRSNEEAAELAKRSATQGKHAVRNAGRAAKTAVDPYVETIENKAENAFDDVRDFAREVPDIARDNLHRLERTTDDAVKTARRVNPQILSRMSGDTGIGFLALSVALYAGAVAFGKFRQAASGSSHVLDRQPTI